MRGRSMLVRSMLVALVVALCPNLAFAQAAGDLTVAFGDRAVEIRVALCQGRVEARGVR